ncbi:MAG: VOC family protein [Rhodospirillaceae bacterium]|jgi:catechol 2,3-dioxygenase-like lactoylglutathione lyase family enzyme
MPKSLSYSLIIINILLWGVPAMTQEPAIPDNFVLSPLMRSTHFVRDLDESLKLYRDILGLRPRVERTLEGERLDAVLGTKGKPVKLAILQSGDSVFANVGLFQFIDETPMPKPEPRTYAQTGDAAVVFLTNDIFGIYEKVKAAGYAIVSAPLILFPQEGSATQSYEMLFFDDDGIGVNLIQRDVPTPH